MVASPQQEWMADHDSPWSGHGSRAGLALRSSSYQAPLQSAKSGQSWRFFNYAPGIGAGMEWAYSKQ